MTFLSRTDGPEYNAKKIPNIASNMLDGIFSAAENVGKSTENPADYRNSDGLLICGVCGERKTTRYTFGENGIREVHCLCKCEQAEQERKDAERKANEKSVRISHALQDLHDSGVIDSRLSGCRFEDDDLANPKQSQFAHKYVDNFKENLEKNIGLLMCGGVGTGKTFLAGCISDALLKKNYFVISSSINAIAAAMKRNFGEDEPAICRYLASCDLLVLDDFGTQRDTEFMNEQVYRIIDTRYNARKPVIITTNLTMEDFRADNLPVEKQRVYDRIAEMCMAIPFKGKSRRAGIQMEKRRFMLREFE